MSIPNWVNATREEGRMSGSPIDLAECFSVDFVEGKHITFARITFHLKQPIRDKNRHDWIFNRDDEINEYNTGQCKIVYNRILKLIGCFDKT